MSFCFVRSGTTNNLDSRRCGLYDFFLLFKVQEHNIFLIEMSSPTKDRHFLLEELLEETNSLPTEILKYELLGRGIRPAQAIKAKYDQLAKVLYAAQTNMEPGFEMPMECETDLKQCKIHIECIESSFGGTITRDLVDSGLVILKYVEIRLSRK